MTMNTSRNPVTSRLRAGLAFLLLVGCATEQAQLSSVVKPPHTAGRGAIVGKVVDAVTGAPLKDAYVMIVLRDPLPITSAALSAPNGEFEFEKPPGSYELQVEKGGYRTSSTMGLRIMPDRDLLLSVKLKRGEAEDGRSLPAEHLLEPPVKLSGPDPGYTAAAMRHGVQGMMIIVCSITAEGEVRDCYARKSLPYLEDAAIEALQARKYRPARRDGQPIEVTYTFRLELRLP
jgi:TonB family protein